MTKLRELATQEALAHGYECDDVNRQYAIDLAVMVGEMAVKEFAEELKDTPHFDAQGDKIDATLRTFLGED